MDDVSLNAPLIDIMSPSEIAYQRVVLPGDSVTFTFEGKPEKAGVYTILFTPLNTIDLNDKG